MCAGWMRGGVRIAHVHAQAVHDEVALRHLHALTVALRKQQSGHDIILADITARPSSQMPRTAMPCQCGPCLTSRQLQHGFKHGTPPIGALSQHACKQFVVPSSLLSGAKPGWKSQDQAWPCARTVM